MYENMKIYNYENMKVKNYTNMVIYKCTCRKIQM